jgi:hypothetical protein
MITRNVPGAGRDDVDAASLRAIVCAYEFPGLRWVESFWDEEAGTITCFYEGRDAVEVEEHARRARIPCDVVREVTPFGPGDYAHMAASEEPARARAR